MINANTIEIQVQDLDKVKLNTYCSFGNAYAFVCLDFLIKSNKDLLLSLSFSKSCSFVGRVYIPAATAVLTVHVWYGAQTWA